jgi:hypothetical protein
MQNGTETSRIGQVERQTDRQNKQKERGIQKMTGRIGLPEQIRQHKNAVTVLPGQAPMTGYADRIGCETGRAGEVKQHRQNGARRLGQTEQDIQNRTHRIGLA